MMPSHARRMFVTVVGSGRAAFGSRARCDVLSRFAWCALVVARSPV
jgi:hypothetical protein